MILENAPIIHGIGGRDGGRIDVAAGAETRRLHSWPDVVGEKINPWRRLEGGGFGPGCIGTDRRDFL